MKFSSKSRYAIIALSELAVQKGMTVSLPQIAATHCISLQYLEKIFQNLKDCELVDSVRGKSGGYVLKKPSSQITLKLILDALNEPISMNACKNKKNCLSDCHQCAAHNFLSYVGKEIEHLFTRLTLSDLLTQNKQDKWSATHLINTDLLQQN